MFFGIMQNNCKEALPLPDCLIDVNMSFSCTYSLSIFFWQDGEPETGKLASRDQNAGISTQEVFPNYIDELIDEISECPWRWLHSPQRYVSE
jgi:hypothetical protein